jgi:hypothetical protein
MAASSPCPAGTNQYYVIFTDGSYSTFCISPANAAANDAVGMTVIPGKTVASIKVVPNSYTYSQGGVNDPNNSQAGLEQDWLTSTPGNAAAATSGAGSALDPSSPNYEPPGQRLMDGTALSDEYAGHPLWVWLALGAGGFLLLALVVSMSGTR